ncbi:efflux RND transporter permease subunit [Ketobacter sp.]
MLLDRINHAIVRHPLLVILACLLCVAALASALPRTQITTDFEEFFPDQDENLVAYHGLQSTYTNVDNVFIAVAPKSGNVFSAETLSILQDITEQAWQLPYSQRVDSITNFQHTIAEDDDLLVEDLVTAPAPNSPEKLAGIRQIAVNEPQLVNRLISPDAKMAGINVIVNFHQEADKGAAIKLVVKSTREFVKSLKTKYPQADFYLVGKVMSNNAFKEATLYDMKNLVPLALLVALVCIAGFMFVASGSILTSLSGTFATLVIIVTSVLAAMGAMVFIGISVSPPVANAPTMILTLAIADCMHLLATYFQNRQAGQDKRAAMENSLHLNYQPVMLTSLTTIIGFLSLNFSASPPFRDLGNVVAVGVFAAWVFSVVLLPALVMVLPFDIKPGKQKSGGNNDWLANFVIKRRLPIFIITGAAVLFSTSFIFNNRLNDVWAEYFDTRTEIRQHADYVRYHLTTNNTISYSLDSQEEGGISNPAFLQTVEQFSDWLSAQPEVLHVTTYTDIMKRLNKTMHNDDPAWYKIPDQRELAAQYLLLYEFSLPFGLDLNNLLNSSKSSTRITATVRDSSTDSILSLQRRSQDWMKEHAPKSLYHPGTSSDIMFAHMGYSNIRSMLEGAFIALLIISVVLGFALRSLKFGLISLVPNLIPAAVGFGIWGLTVGQIGLGLSAVAGMTLGIVVDYTVHFISKYLRAKREQNLSEPDAIRYAFRTVGTALFVTTIILTANFGVLAFSDFRLSADMGLLTAITIVVALIIDFFFLPPLLMFLAGKKPTTVTQTLTETGSSAPESL